MKILEVLVEIISDEYPDLSHLGHYHRSWKHGCIDTGVIHANKLRYFSPGNSAEETGNPDSPTQDLERMEDYNDGQWSMVGIKASAIVKLTDSDLTQSISSGGLWGIESDSDKLYFWEVGQEELAQLRTELEAVGFSEEDITAAFQDMKEKIR